MGWGGQGRDTVVPGLNEVVGGGFDSFVSFTFQVKGFMASVRKFFTFFVTANRGFVFLITGRRQDSILSCRRLSRK